MSRAAGRWNNNQMPMGTHPTRPPIRHGPGPARSSFSVLGISSRSCPNGEKLIPGRPALETAGPARPGGSKSRLAATDGGKAEAGKPAHHTRKEDDRHDRCELAKAQAGHTPGGAKWPTISSQDRTATVGSASHKRLLFWRVYSLTAARLQGGVSLHGT